MSKHITYYLYSIIRRFNAFQERRWDRSLCGSASWVDHVSFSLDSTLNRARKRNYAHHISRGKLSQLERIESESNYHSHQRGHNYNKFVEQ